MGTCPGVKPYGLTVPVRTLTVYHNMWYVVNMSKKQTSIRLSEEAQRLIEQLSKHLGISQSAVLEQAIRTLARHEGIPTPAPNKERGLYPPG
jgi:hypothetical protein